MAFGALAYVAAFSALMAVVSVMVALPIGVLVAWVLARGEFRGKAVVETWTNLTPAIWLALDGSWTQAHETYSARARLGYRVLPQLSIGFEEALLGNTSGDLARSGLFARYDWSGGEVALAAGVSGQRFDFKDTSTDRTWMALSVMFRF